MRPVSVEVLLPRVLSISARIIYLRAYQSVWDQVGVSSTGGTQKRMDGGTKFIRRVCENLFFTVDRLFGRFPKDVGGILACDANQFRAFARCLIIVKLQTSFWPLPAVDSTP